MSVKLNSINGRNSSLELLRIICIICVIICHFCGHGIITSIDITYENLNWQIVFSQIGSLLGNIANYTFLIITGYYMINSNNYSIKKILSLIVQIYFYAFLITGIAYFTGNLINYSTMNLLSTIFPTFFSYNWFVNCYIILYLFIPFINKLVKNIELKELKRLIILLLILGVILPKFKATTYLNSDFTYFLLMYLIGAYIRLNGISKCNLKTWNILLYVFIFLEITSVIILDMIGIVLKNNFFIENACFFNPFFAIIISICLFMIFCLKKEFVSEFVNNISKTVLGIYLIHDNPIIRSILWKRYFYIDCIESNYFLLFLILEVFIIFVVCCAIEYARIQIFNMIRKKKEYER